MQNQQNSKSYIMKVYQVEKRESVLDIIKTKNKKHCNGCSGIDNSNAHNES